MLDIASFGCLCAVVLSTLQCQPSSLKVESSLTKVEGGEICLGSSQPPRPTNIGDFYFTYRITDGDYADFLSALFGQADYSRCLNLLIDPQGQIEDLGEGQVPRFRSLKKYSPIYNLTFTGALAYALWTGLSLPTEAEWEVVVHTYSGNRRSPVWTLDSVTSPEVKEIMRQERNPVSMLVSRSQDVDTQKQQNVGLRLVHRLEELTIATGTEDCGSHEFLATTSEDHSLNFECHPCHKKCKTCVGPQIGKCLSCCESDAIFSKANPGFCVKQSSANQTYFDDCEDCTAAFVCNTCSQSLAQCAAKYMFLKREHALFKSISSEQLRSAHEHMSNDGFYGDLNTDINRGLLFLYTKHVYSNNRTARIHQFTELLRPDYCSNRSLCKKKQQRFLRLTSDSGETQLPKVPSYIHKFSTCEFPGYNQSNTFLLRYQDALVQRSQLSGLCYMHAPAVLQHYLIAKTFKEINPNATLDHNMIDLVQYIRTYFNSSELETYLFTQTGGGGFAREFLKTILQPESEIVDTYFLHPITALQKFGPLLVYNFKVYKDFTNVTQHQHYGTHHGKFVGYHAMVLAGYREEKGQIRYLLQNWWASKQFIEVDEEYLIKCEARFAYVETMQRGIPEKLTKSVGLYFEAMDTEEGPPQKDCGGGAC